jgi:predicted TIM-barrel enzyme
MTRVLIYPRATLTQAANLSIYLARVRKHTTLPIMVGFGVSKREHVLEVGKDADGVVVGSAIVKVGDTMRCDAMRCAALWRSCTPLWNPESVPRLDARRVSCWC